MVTLISSEIANQSSNETGRTVTEKHTFSDGSEFLHSYTTTLDVDIENVLTLRASKIEAELIQKEQEELLASNYVLPLYKAEFRDRFTTEEQIAIDVFNETYMNSPMLTEEQKAAILSALKYYHDCTKVVLTHAKTIAFVNMYESLGLIGPGRAAEVLA